MPDVILPVLNEAEALPWVLSRMPEGYLPIVADNDSTDGSAQIARDLGARVVAASPRGFGAAVHAGLDLADHPDGLVCIMDADASFDPAQLPLVADPVLAGISDLVLGARAPTTSGAWPLHARLGNRVVAHQLAARTGLQLTDIGPMRAIRAEHLRRLDLQDRRFGYPLEMVVAAVAADLRVSEVSVSYAPRTGRSKVTGTLPGTLRAVRDMSAILRSIPDPPRA